MINEKKSYKVHIFEEQYILSSDEPENLVIQAAHMVDKAMKEISNYYAIADTKKIAVLAALRIAIALLDCEGDSENQHQKLAALRSYIEQEISLLGI